VKKKHARSTSAGTPGLAALVAAAIPHTVHAYDHDDATSRDIGYGLEAAHALDVDPEQVFKTLTVETSRGHVLAVVPVVTQLDLKAMAQAIGDKRVFLVPSDVAERVSGSVVGGISPLGGRTRLSVVLDESAQLFETIFVSAGRRGLDVELSAADLLRLTGGVVAAIAR
jgi:Cys-tRNA(Pro)/Cys-tRNA(Cys) deacylase